MAFDALDSLLRDQQFNLAQQSNFDLPFGGTTDREFDFLSRAGAANQLAPSFLSFLAGVSGANLATQQNRQLQFDRATQLRNQESNLALRGAQTRNALLTGDAAEARLPFVGQQAEANLNSTLLGNDNLQITNDFLPAVTQSRLDFQGAQTQGLQIENRFAPETIASQNNARNAQTDNLVARTEQQQFINQNLQQRENLDRQERQAGIALRQAQTNNQQQLASINAKKNNAFAEINKLDQDLQRQRISKAQYDAQIAQRKAEAFDAIRAEETLLNNARIMRETGAANASNALAALRDETDPNLRRGSRQAEYRVPTVVNRQTPSNPAPAQNNALPAPITLSSNPASTPSNTPPATQQQPAVTLTDNDFNLAVQQGVPVEVAQRARNIFYGKLLQGVSPMNLSRAEQDDLLAIMRAIGR